MRPLFQTLLNSCPIGCGSPFVFLQSSAHKKVLLFCPGCKGCFDSGLRRERQPRNYRPGSFDKRDLRLPSLEHIQAAWPECAIEEASGPERDEHLDTLREHFGACLML